MQGDSAVQDMDFQRALKASPFEEKDLPQLSADIGSAYTRLTPEQKQQLQELADDLDTFGPEDLKNLRYFLGYLAQNKARYGLIVRKMYATGILDEGVLPPKYEPAFFALLTSLVDQAIAKRGESSPEEAPAQGFAKGGIASLKASARKVQKAGRYGDTVLAHITPQEAALLKSRGGAGTINPKTGLPEYRSMFSIKSINNFFKKAAPIILPIALNFLVPGLGAIASGFIGAGVGSLIGGAKPKDALRSALIGGVTGGLTAGIGNVVSGGNFFTGVEGALPSGFGGTPAVSGSPSIGDRISNLFSPATGAPVPQANVPGVPQGPDMFGNPLLSAKEIADGTVKAAPSSGIGALVDKGVGVIQRNPLTSVAVAGGLGALAAGSMGGKDKAAAPLIKGPTTRELMAQNPSRYSFNISDFRPRYTTGMGLFSAATGGLAAKGGKVDGPGTGTSDSIPARLSDGEFVFTAKAVRGAGGGDRMKGAKKMYEMMNKFERMA
jgi:hypothetical protein